MQSTSKYSKAQNPRLCANPVSVLFFLHLLPTFWRNFRNGLKEEELFEVLDEHKSSILGQELEKLWNLAQKKRTKYALHLSLWKMFYKEIILTGVLQGVKEISVIVFMPYAVGQLVSHFGNNTTSISKSSAYIFATVIILCLFLDKIINHALVMWLKHISMKMRVGCCSLVYRKSLNLNVKSLHQNTNIGHIINLMSNDVSKFDYGFMICHYLWTAPLQAAVAAYMLYGIIGISAFTGMLFILSFVPLQIYMGRCNSFIRLKTALRTDERIRLMNEILSGIQIIKMYTWEKPFAKLVSMARRLEMKSIRRHFYVESFIFSLEMFITRTSIFISIVTYLALGNNINADIAYSATAIYNVIRPVITIIFSLSILCMAEIHISVLRLEQFLNLEEIDSAENRFDNHAMLPNGEVKNHMTSPRILFKDVCVKWTDSTGPNILSDINMDLAPNQLVAIIGPVGSGKTTFLSTILKEVPFTTGKIDVKGKISYASQESWLFLESVRQNILFGDLYDENRYNDVIRVCALESDFNILPQGDLTIVREKGRSLSGGQKARINLARCIYKHADIYLLDDPLSAVDSKVGQQLYDKCIKKFLKNKLRILVTHQLQYLHNADKIIILKNGIISDSGNYSQLQDSNELATLLKEDNTNLQKHDDFHVDESTISNNENIDNKDNENDNEAVITGGLGFSTYRDYFGYGGNWFVLGIFLVFIVSHAVASGGDYFVSYWLNSEEDAGKRQSYNVTFSDRSKVIVTYFGITLGTIFFGILHSTVLFLLLNRASESMHKTIFNKIVHATMHFFNQNPSGRILNRFSKDMGVVDEYIPYVLIDIADITFVLVTTMILSCLVNIWFVLPCAGLLIMLYLIRIVYIQTSRQVKRIEGITRSPIYNHTTASVNGLTTIRAYNAQRMLIHEFDSIQDNHNSAWYLYISSSEAFGLWIDIACIIFIAVIVYSFLLLNKGYYGGDVGLIITLYIALAGILQWGIFQWSELENNMTSVERILEYCKVETEPKRPPISNLPRNWPEYGKIIFNNVSMKYDSGSLVLKNLSFMINPGEKIGIVGRTGAGKSSTISALFQFYPLTGSIVIDGVNITNLPLEILRSKISIIPQECVLFSGSMRKNLDPFDEYNDNDLWSALEQVEIKNILEKSPGGLSASITESGSNFSVGQRQLICLARAIIRNNKIIVMDEATANIDSHTDRLIQKTIKKNFVDCTIITIAHRLHTIMDTDKVLVMEEGQVVEFDSPHILLQNEKGIFQSMVQATGTASAKRLHAIAKENYLLKLKRNEESVSYNI